MRTTRRTGIHTEQTQLNWFNLQTVNGHTPAQLWSTFCETIEVVSVSHCSTSSINFQWVSQWKLTRWKLTEVALTPSLLFFCEVAVTHWNFSQLSLKSVKFQWLTKTSVNFQWVFQWNVWTFTDSLKVHWELVRRANLQCGHWKFGGCSLNPKQFCTCCIRQDKVCHQNKKISLVQVPVREQLLDLVYWCWYVISLTTQQLKFQWVTETPLSCQWLSETSANFQRKKGSFRDSLKTSLVSIKFQQDSGWVVGQTILLVFCRQAQFCSLFRSLIQHINRNLQ